MRIGLVARADSTGLAVQTQDFARHMRPHRVLLVDTTRWGRKVDQSLFPDSVLWSTPAPDVTPVRDRVVDEFLDDVDVVWTAETPYNYYLLLEAERRGVPTVLHFNYEFLDLMAHKDVPQPTVYAAPTTWHLADVKQRVGLGAKVTEVPVPVDTDRFVFRPRLNVERVLHTVGTGTGEDRNGTRIVLDAMRLVRSPIRCTVRSQKPLGRAPRNVDLCVDTVDDPTELYGDEAVFVMPRRFGGLCLPMLEALACGMPVFGHDREPERGLLSREWRIPAGRDGILQTRAPIGLWGSDPQVLADMLDSLFENPDVMWSWSMRANLIAQNRSWGRLKPVYEDLLAGL